MNIVLGTGIQKQRLTLFYVTKQAFLRIYIVNTNMERKKPLNSKSLNSSDQESVESSDTKMEKNIWDI